MNLTLKFRHAGEEVVVLKALVDAYQRVAVGIETLRTACAPDDLVGLLTLADMTDANEERISQLERRHRRAVTRIEQEEADDIEAQVMAQGSAALDSGAGAPPAQTGAAEATPVDRFCFASERQHLPAVATAGATQTSTGAASL